MSSSAAPGVSPAMRRLAQGRGFSIHEYVCTAGPQDRRFEERHDRFTIAAVLSGSFVYQSAGGKGLMHPGSLLLGNVGDCYECGHDHSTGDRCLSFQFEAELFAELASAAAGTMRFRFGVAAMPALDPLLPLLAAVEATPQVAAEGAAALRLEELATEVAEVVLGAASGRSGGAPALAHVTGRDEQRISEVLRYAEERVSEPLELDELAAVAALSKYHFLRTFRRVVGRSPYQYLLHLRLRRAALELMRSAAAVSAIAFDAGFGDLSTFNHRFREVFGESPQAYRRRYAPAAVVTAPAVVSESASAAPAASAASAGGRRGQSRPS